MNLARSFKTGNEGSRGLHQALQMYKFNLHTQGAWDCDNNKLIPPEKEVNTRGGGAGLGGPPLLVGVE